ncbi:ATP-binding protein [Streptomyces sp. NPDC006235]|uniref:ATP-binding protein n=1 Tax=Streptomyces sp. NPDC006235 TaxID=3156736 RepID=UPI0033B794AF
MEPVPVNEDGTAPGEQTMQTTVALEGDGTVIAQARHLATQFLTRAQTEQGPPVSQRAVDLTQLVVSELVTNARKYAPGQHGLEIVMAVAQGFEVQREPVGKRITARIALLDDPGGAIAGRSPL